MLDKYTKGNIKRISPEAPVSVLHVENEHALPGGAGNVALNLLSLKAEVCAIGRVGKDKDGEDLISFLKKEGVNVENVLFQEDYPTAIKNRLIAISQQVIRIDKEKICPLDIHLENELIGKLPKLIQKQDVIAISDYGKGFLSFRLIQAVIENARKFKVPVIVDPKGTDFSKYKKCNIIKPNLTEAYLAAGLSPKEPLEKAAEVLLTITGSDKLIITRSQDGISLFDKNGRKDFPVRSKEVKDVTGAGDTVLAMIATCIGNGFTIEEALNLSNIAAGIAIEHLGCARVSLGDLAKRLLEFDTGSKIFEESHLFALQEVLRDKKFSVLMLDSKKNISMALFKAIFKLAKSERLIVYLKDQDPDEDFISLLSSLSLIDYIILKQRSGFFEKLKPKSIFEIVKGDLKKIV